MLVGYFTGGGGQPGLGYNNGTNRIVVTQFGVSETPTDYPPNQTSVYTYYYEPAQSIGVSLMNYTDSFTSPIHYGDETTDNVGFISNFASPSFMRITWFDYRTLPQNDVFPSVALGNLSVVTGNNTIMPSNVATDVGNTLVFNAFAFNGNPPYSFKWQFGSGSSYGQVVNYTFSKLGDYTVFLTVTDINGSTATANVTVVVNTDPSVTLSVAKNNITLGAILTFHAMVSGGIAPFTFEWYVNGFLVYVGPSIFNASFRSGGVYNFHVVVVDGTGRSAESLNVSIHVFGSPSSLPSDFAWIVYNSSIPIFAAMYFGRRYYFSRARRAFNSIRKRIMSHIWRRH